LRTKYKLSLLISKFNRYGGEGIFTKIIADSNITQYVDLVQHLEEDELPLIVSRFSNSDWILLTDKRLLIMIKDKMNVILHENLTKADSALRAEYDNGVKSKLDFTKILLKDVNNTEITITAEKGLPYQGLLQVLHFIATR
jgi:hypothetical protein